MQQWIAERLRMSLRRARRRPIFTLMVTGVFATAVGSSTVVFGILDAVVLQALPFPRPSDLFSVRCKISGSTGFDSCSVAIAIALREQSRIIDELAYYGFGPTGRDFGDDDLRPLATRRVSSSFFSTLRMRPAHGRWFLNADNTGDANNLVVLSSRTWRTTFGGDPWILGRSIVLDRRPYVVCGVMPPSFVFPGSQVGAWVLDPLTVQRMEEAALYDSTVVVRVREGATEEQLRAELSVVAQRLSGQPEHRDLVGVHIEPLRKTVLGSTARVLGLLFGGTHCLLLIVAINLTNLLAAQALASREAYTVRILLGARPVRLLLDHVIEVLLWIGPAAHAVSLVIASVALRIFQDVGGITVSRSELAVIGHRAWSYSVLLSLITLIVAAGVAFVPVASGPRSLHKSHRNADAALGRYGLGHLQRLSLAVQVAVATALIAIAGAAGKVLVDIRNPALGFDSRNLLAIILDPGLGGSKSVAAWYAWVEGLIPELRRLQGVQGVATASFAPFAGTSITPPVPFEESTGQWTLSPPVTTQTVSADYFRVLKVPLVAGRLFTDEERESSPCVVVINESFARLMGGATAAVGRMVSENRETGTDAVRCAITGVVGDVRDVSVDEEPLPSLYFSALQRSDVNRTLLVRVDGRVRPGRIASVVQSLISARSSPQELRAVINVRRFVEGATLRRRVLSYQMLFFAVGSASIAFMGMLAMATYFVGERRGEIGIRLALGANRFTIHRLIVQQFAAAAALGVTVGVALAYGANRLGAAWQTGLPLIGTSGWLLTVLVMAVAMILTSAWPVATLRTSDVGSLLRVD